MRYERTRKAVLAVALAFGLGNTKLAGEITRRWYESGRSASRARGHAKEGEKPSPGAIQRELGIEEKTESPLGEGR